MRRADIPRVTSWPIPAHKYSKESFPALESGSWVFARPSRIQIQLWKWQLFHRPGRYYFGATRGLGSPGQLQEWEAAVQCCEDWPPAHTQLGVLKEKSVGDLLHTSPSGPWSHFWNSAHFLQNNTSNKRYHLDIFWLIDNRQVWVRWYFLLLVALPCKIINSLRILCLLSINQKISASQMKVLLASAPVPEWGWGGRGGWGGGQSVGWGWRMVLYHACVFLNKAHTAHQNHYNT